jgi:subtilisin family serine protease
MSNKIVRCIVAVFLLFSVFNVPFNLLNAESRNFALIYYRDPSKISTCIQKGFKIIELYSEYFLSEINEEQKTYLNDEKIFYEELGDITKVKIGDYTISSTEEKTLTYPEDLNKYMVDYSPEKACIHIIQFIGPVKSGWDEAFNNLNIKFYAQTDHFAFIANIRGVDAEILRKLSFIRAIGYLPPVLKVNKELINIEPESKVDLEILAIVDFNLDEFSKYIGIPKEDIRLSKREDCSLLFIKQFPIIKIKTLQDYPDIIHIKKYVSPEVLNAEAAQVVGIRGLSDENLLTNDLPAGLEGEGEIVGVGDTGISQHPAFMDPTFNDKVIATKPDSFWEDNHGHGTHVSGTILGTGAGHPSGSTRYKGMAPKAKLVSQKFLYGTYNYEFNELFGEAYSLGAKVHNNSWGYYSYTIDGDYNQNSVDIDDFLWNNRDFTIVFAAGNCRNDDMYSINPDPTGSSLDWDGAAKNNVVSGACRNRKPGYNENYIAYFSSIGPTHDGRIKPDVVAPGNYLESCKRPSGYVTMSGTSMAAPVTTGSLALIREYYKKVANLQPAQISSALLKATLINGCVTENLEDYYYSSYYPGGNTLLSVPSPVCGWGRINVKQSLYPDNGISFYYLNNNGMPRNGRDTYYIDVNSSSAPLKLTLVWTDLPGTPKPYHSTDKDLINNLDLRIISPEGKLYWGNQLYSYHNNNFYKGESFESIPNPSAVDTINNVEVINISLPTVGKYEIDIISSGNNQSVQPYALVVAGNAIKSSAPVIPPTPPTPPTDLKAKTKCDSIELKWNASERRSYPIQAYEIYRVQADSGIVTLAGTVEPDKLTYTDTNIIYGKKYNYFVKARDDHNNYSDSSNVVTAGEVIPPSTPYLSALPDPLSVVLNWSPSKTGTCPIMNYAIFRSCSVDPGLTPVAMVSGNTRTWADTNIEQGSSYCYYVQAIDAKGSPSLPSNIINVSVPLGTPVIAVSAEANRNEFSTDDEIIIKVEVVNAGTLNCPNTIIVMYIPQDIEYIKADVIRGIVGADRSVEFNIGRLEYGKKFTFYVYCKVKGNVTINKALEIIFDAKKCGSNSDIDNRYVLHIMLAPKKGGTSSLSISTYLKNIKSDPDTGEAYIDFDTPLELTLKIDGGTAPYTLKIDWGDGSSKEEKKVNAAEINLTHKFESRGTIEIKFEVTDAVGRNKKATVKLKVK